MNIKLRWNCNMPQISWWNIHDVNSSSRFCLALFFIFARRTTITDRTRFGNTTRIFNFQWHLNVIFNIFLCFSNIRNHLSNFSYLVCISCKIFIRWRFYLFLKAENSRRVVESCSDRTDHTDRVDLNLLQEVIQGGLILRKAKKNILFETWSKFFTKIVLKTLKLELNSVISESIRNK